MSATTFWLVLALLLAGAEMLSGSFYLITLGAAALCGGAAASLGAGLSVQIIIGALAALLGVSALHRWRRTQATRNPAQNGMAMETGARVSVLHWQGANRARVQYRGAGWDAELAPGVPAGHETYLLADVRGSTLILTLSQEEHSHAL